MKNKGFTLIELLGVIIIIALLMVLIFPSVINSIKDSSNKTDSLTYKLIYNAADIHISNHLDYFKKVDQNKYIILLSDLVAEDLLASPIKLSDSGADITNTKCIQVTYSNNKFNYELKDAGTCIEDIAE